MESSSETVSNTITDNSQSVGKHSESDNQPVEVEGTAIVKNHNEKISQTRQMDKETDKNGTHTESEQNEVDLTKQKAVAEIETEEDEECESKNINETKTDETFDRPNGMQTKNPKEVSVKQPITITKELPCTATTITTPIADKNHVEEKEEFKLLMKEIVQNVQSSVEEDEQQQEEQEEETNGEKRIKKIEKVESSEEEEAADNEEEEGNDESQERKETDKTIVDVKQTFKKEQIQRYEKSKQLGRKEENVDALPSTATNTSCSNIQNKQDNLNDTLKDIISSIDSNIIAEEKIAALKETELKLIKKQQQLAKDIEQQQLLAQNLAKENQLKQQQINNSKYLFETNKSVIPQNAYQPVSNVSTYSNYEEKQDENTHTRRPETFESSESTNIAKKVDLHKIFTPATDAEEILPKNRKLYASSAFYSPTLHPTVEDQIELARRISHSLSDISNQQSRGQSMYVNRKKRSIKWIHEGCAQEKSVKTSTESLNQNEDNDEDIESNISHLDKVPLKFLMNPCGQIRNINSLKEAINTETGLFSPDVSVEVMTALQTQKGKGAELFAKRRKVSEKWVVDENNVGAQSPSGLPDYHQHQQHPKPPTSPSILPAYTDAAKHRVQLNLHQEHLLEKYAKPGLNVVQTPWEAALSPDSATAFAEEQKLSPYPTSTLTPSPTPQTHDASDVYYKPNVKEVYYKYPQQTGYQLPQAQPERQYKCSNSQRELAYKPSIPQGWKAPNMALPKGLYMPKEIPIQSYAPPPVTPIPVSVSPHSSNIDLEIKPNYKYKTFTTTSSPHFSLPESMPETKILVSGANAFSPRKFYQQVSTKPSKQQNLPDQSYQRVNQNSSQNVPLVSFNPSPLPYNKLAKFENPPTDDTRHIAGNHHLNIRANEVRNKSPTPFGDSPYKPFTPSSAVNNYGGTPSSTPRSVSSFGRNTPNPHTNITSNQISNAPTYNRLARGWGCSDSNSCISPGYQSPRNYISPLNKYQSIVNSSYISYTDF